MVDFDDLQKTPRKTDWDYVSHIKEMGCLIEGSMRVDPHHMASRGSGGSDFTCVPLCRAHHREIEQIGLRKFEDKYHRNMWREAHAILEKWFLRND